MRKIIIIAASAFLLATLISGCANNVFFSNAVSNKSTDSVINAAVADQVKSLSDIQAEAKKMNEKDIKAQIDSYNLLIAEKETELASYQKSLMQTSADQANLEKRVSLKNRVTALTYSLDDLNKKLQIFIDQLKVIQK